MFTENNIIDVEISCSMCDSDDVDWMLDTENNKILFRCNNCGAQDSVEIMD